MLQFVTTCVRFWRRQRWLLIIDLIGVVCLIVLSPSSSWSVNAKALAQLVMFLDVLGLVMALFIHLWLEVKWRRHGPPKWDPGPDAIIAVSLYWQQLKSRWRTTSMMLLGIQSGWAGAIISYSILVDARYANRQLAIVDCLFGLVLTPTLVAGAIVTSELYDLVARRTQGRYHREVSRQYIGDADICAAGQTAHWPTLTGPPIRLQPYDPDETQRILIPGPASELAPLPGADLARMQLELTRLLGINPWGTAAQTDEPPE